MLLWFVGSLFLEVVVEVLEGEVEFWRKNESNGRVSVGYGLCVPIRAPQPKVRENKKSANRSLQQD